MFAVDLNPLVFNSGSSFFEIGKVIHIYFYEWQQHIIIKFTATVDSARA